MRAGDRPPVRPLEPSNVLNWLGIAVYGAVLAELVLIACVGGPHPEIFLGQGLVIVHLYGVWRVRPRKGQYRDYAIFLGPVLLVGLVYALYADSLRLDVGRRGWAGAQTPTRGDYYPGSDTLYLLTLLTGIVAPFPAAFLSLVADRARVLVVAALLALGVALWLVV